MPGASISAAAAVTRFVSANAMNVSTLAAPLASRGGSVLLIYLDTGSCFCLAAAVHDPPQGACRHPPGPQCTKALQ